MIMPALLNGALSKCRVWPLPSIRRARVPLHPLG